MDPIKVANGCRSEATMQNVADDILMSVELKPK